MTEIPAPVPSLPLSVTCTADGRFSATMSALAHRVAEGTGNTAVADRFTTAVTTGMNACLAHLGDDGSHTLSVELTASETDVQGYFRWARLPDEGATFTAQLEATLASVADRVECGHSGADAFCCVTCVRS